MDAHDDDVEGMIRAGKTARGTPHISYSQFLALRVAARQKQYVIQSVEIYGGREGAQRLVGTYSYPHSEYSSDWLATVRASSDCVELMLEAQPDKESLRFIVWLDYQ